MIQGNRNKRFVLSSVHLIKTKTELENDKNKKIKDDVKSKDRLQKERIFQMIEGQINL